MTTCLIHSLGFSRLIYCCSLLCNLPVNLMYTLERIHRRAICVLYKLNVALIVSISDLIRSLGCLKFRYIVYIGYCILHIRLYTVEGIK